MSHGLNTEDFQLISDSLVSYRVTLQEQLGEVKQVSVGEPGSTMTREQRTRLQRSYTQEYDALTQLLNKVDTFLTDPDKETT